MTAAVGDATELLVVLVDESHWMAGDVPNRGGRDPVGVTEAVEATASQHAVDGRARPTQLRTEPIWTVSGVGSGGQDLGFRSLSQSSR